MDMPSYLNSLLSIGPISLEKLLSQTNTFSALKAIQKGLKLED
jgi:hypothetical protein